MTNGRAVTSLPPRRSPNLLLLRKKNLSRDPSRMSRTRRNQTRFPRAPALTLQGVEREDKCCVCVHGHSWDVCFPAAVITSRGLGQDGLGILSESVNGTRVKIREEGRVMDKGQGVWPVMFLFPLELLVNHCRGKRFRPCGAKKHPSPNLGWG